eukprot:GFUD01034463.1.p1 GENE.GFUD01034463.1~~GFUD01034463.1.p1  ORF type:complete len:292 (+),score=58.97 GFUD01034463.1:48-923(+)
MNSVEPDIQSTKLPAMGSSPSTLLGEGCFGKVYKENRGGVICAVKKIPKYKRDGLKEAEVLMNLDNAYIIKYLGHHIEGANLCIVMEFCDRGSLKEFIVQQAQDPATVHFKEWAVWRVVYHLATALDYLHTLRPDHILHRDLKEDNILGQTQSNGRISFKLGDFGIAKLLTETAQGEYYGTAIAGAACCMAPEVCRDWTKYAMASDIWSLGCIMMFLCNKGEPLFSHSHEVMRWRGLSQSSIRRGYSDDLVNLIARMLSPRKQDRPSAANIGRECTFARQGKDGNGRYLIG